MWLRPTQWDRRPQSTIYILPYTQVNTACCVQLEFLEFGRPKWNLAVPSWRIALHPSRQVSALERQYAAAQTRLERCQADLAERDKELAAAVAKWVGVYSKAAKGGGGRGGGEAWQGGLRPTGGKFAWCAVSLARTASPSTSRSLIVLLHMHRVLSCRPSLPGPTDGSTAEELAMENCVRTALPCLCHLFC